MIQGRLNSVLRTAVCLAALGVAALPATAAEGDTRYGLFIGINEFNEIDGQRMTTLAGCVLDAINARDMCTGAGPWALAAHAATRPSDVSAASTAV